jgi:PAT family beta-lactamase induction signal transducer AmpG
MANRLSALFHSAIASAAIYADRRLFTILLLGFSSGLPLALTLGTLSIWLARVGVDKTTIGLFAAVTLPYALKFGWAPLIDRLALPYLSRRFGRRRGWCLLTQALLAAAIVAMALTDPVAAPGLLAAFAFLVAIASASQDVVIDAYRVEILDPKRYGAGAAAIVLGYRLGLLVSGAGALYLAGAMEWRGVYLVMAALVSVGAITILVSPEPAQPAAALSPMTQTGAAVGARFAAWLQESIIKPFAEFATRQRWYLILIFVLLFKLGDQLAGVMTGPFLVELGFSNEEIAYVGKIYGFVATIAGLALGGLLIARYGVLPVLWLGGGLQLGSNFLFSVQAAIGHDLGLLALTVGFENLAGGIGTAALVAYLSGLCTLAYTATQYALLSALAAVARTVLSTPAGWLADRLGWIDFFVMSAVLALPGLILLSMLRRTATLRTR